MLVFDPTRLRPTMLSWSGILGLIIFLSACSQSLPQDASELETTDFVVQTETGAQQLEGMTVSNQVLVRLEHSRGYREIQFFVDAPASEDPVAVDIAAPFEFLLDTTKLSKGEHSLSAVAVSHKGRLKMVANAHFEVDNGEAPAPTLPEGWISADIGEVGMTGLASYDEASGRFEVKGSGAARWNEADSLHYVYQTLPGDGELTVKLESLDEIVPWTKAGVMVRESLDADAPHVALTLTPKRGSLVFHRAEAGGIGSSSYDETQALPNWLKLARAGDDVYAYTSPDGETWTLLEHHTVPMSARAYIGLMVTSQDNGRRATGIFSALTVSDVPTLPIPEPPTEPEPPAPEPPAPEPEPEVPEADYYVAINGSDSNDGSLTRPFRTIHKAGTVVQAGDTVFIRGGVYKEYLQSSSWVTSGEEGKPITIAGYPGETAIIDGGDEHWSDHPKSPSSPMLIYLRNLNWYVFENLTLRNSAGRAMDLIGDHNVIRNITTHDNHGDGIHIKGNHNLIEASVTYGNYSEMNGGDSSDGLKIAYGDSNIVRRVLAYNNSDDGIDLWDTTNSLAEYNVAHSNGYGTSGNGIGFKLSNGGRADAGHMIRHNIAYQNSYMNFSDNGGGGITLYNNTSWAGKKYGFVLRGRDGRAGHVLKNNLSYQDVRRPLVDQQYGGGSLPVQVNNSWNLSIDNPEFLSLEAASSAFLSLASGSRAIDAGVDVGGSFAGTAPDLGALERGQTLASMIPSFAARTSLAAFAQAQP